MKSLSFYKKVLSRQQGQADCGVACLQTLIKFYEGAEISLEELRNLSGTNMQGTSLLGLYESANKIGLKAQGCNATIEALQEHPSPTILHILVEERLQHYVVCFGWDKDKNGFIIGDPAKGVSVYTVEELEKVWVSKNLLTLELTKDFSKRSAVDKYKRAWLIDLIKEDINVLTVSAFIGVIISVLGLTLSIFTQKLVDDILPAAQLNKLALALVLLIILLQVKGSFGYVRSVFLARQAKDFNNRIIHNFFRKLLFLPVNFFEQRKTGEMITRMNDTARLQRVVSHIASNAFIDLLIVLTSTGYLFFLEWRIGVFALLSIPVYIIIAWSNNDKIIKNQKELMNKYAATESQYISTVQGIKAIKSNHKEQFFSEQTNTVYTGYQQQVFSLTKIQAKVGWLMESWSSVFTVLVIAWGSYVTIQEIISIGELMAILTIALSISQPVSRLSLINIPISEARIAFDRMYEFIGLKTEKTDEYEHLEEPIKTFELKNINFRFPGRKPILEDVNLMLAPNTITGISGDSGNGKSTLLKIFQKFYDPSKGELIVNGNRNLEDISAHDWRLKIGVVDQHISLFPGNVIENIALSNDPADLEKAVLFCQEFGFHDMIMRLPQNYLTILGENGENLSGGQKQIVALARALFKKPELLLLDEPTAALDMKSEQFVMDLLKKIKKDMTIVVVSHRTAPLELADKGYVLEEGILKDLSATES